jgi:hypothetical protein
MMWLIQWVLVPGILVVILVDGFSLSHRSPNPKAKVSGHAGILAGLIIFVLFMISQQHAIAFSRDTLTVEFTYRSLLLLIAGFCVGFLVKLAIQRVFETRILGVLVLLIFASATIALFDFFFVKTVREYIMFAALSVLLGAFVYRMIFPTDVALKAESQDIEGGGPTADALLRNLTKEQRIEAYSGLCDYLRWVLKRQGDTGGLANVERIISYLETCFEEKIEAGEVSPDEANDIKSYKIWIIAHQESRGAPNRLALFEASERSPESILDYDKKFIKNRESIKREFADKLGHCVNLGLVKK